MKQLLKRLTGTLRGRLTLWYIASMVLVFGLFSIALGGLLWLTLQDQIDHHVHIAVNEARQFVESYQGEERNELIRNLVSAQGMTVVVLSPDGSALLETNSPDVAVTTEHQLQRIITSMSLNSTEPVHFTENELRFAATPAQVLGGKGAVAVGYSTRVIYATFYRILAIAAGAVILLVLPATYGGYRWLKRQLQPLEDVAYQAKSVTGSQALTKRIRLEASTEEIAVIKDAFNHMLIRLESIFKKERDFFADAAHTLKTPLAVLRAQVDELNKGTQKKRNLIATIDDAAATVEDLLYLATITQTGMTPETISLSQIMQDLAELAEHLGQEKRLEVICMIENGITVLADERLLKRALGNIVFNAVQYCRKNDRITLQLLQRNDSILLTVTDTGAGIRGAELGHIFERFYRGKNSNRVKGSGLGLAIAKETIELSGGKIAVESKVGEGTAVEVKFGHIIQPD